MSSYLQAFAQRSSQRPMNEPLAPCGACHQPRGNAAAARELQSSESESSLLDALDFDYTGAELDGLDLWNASMDVGQQEDSGYGFSGEASIARLNNEQGVEGAAGKLNADFVAGSDGWKMGVAATWGEAAYDDRSFEADKVDALEGRIGFGHGVGLGVRAHLGDSDGDGLIECGPGIDVGPLSADLQTELCPVNGADAVLDWWNQ